MLRLAAANAVLLACGMRMPVTVEKRRRITIVANRRQVDASERAGRMSVWTMWPCFGAMVIVGLLRCTVATT